MRPKDPFMGRSWVRELELNDTVVRNKVTFYYFIYVIKLFMVLIVIKVTIILFIYLWVYEFIISDNEGW